MQDSKHPRSPENRSTPTRRIAASLPPDKKARLDADLHRLVALLDARDWDQLRLRTGIRQGARTALDDVVPQYLSVLIEIEGDDLDVPDIRRKLEAQGVTVPDPFYAEMARAGSVLRCLPGRMQVDTDDPSLLPDTTEVIGRIGSILDLFSRERSFIARLGTAVPHLPCLERSIGDIGLPVDRLFHGKTLRGTGVVVGIIDDGCPFAHPDLLVASVGAGPRRFKSRILRLLDQSGPPTTDDIAKGWTTAAFPGRELAGAAIEKAINGPPAAARHITANGWIDEEAVYAYLRYPAGNARPLASHGSRVLGIAAGNGSSLMGHEGVAPDADVIFVQLDKLLIESNPAALSDRILFGVMYIFAEAEKLGKAVVVNVSYGGYQGAHDGTSFWEKTLDQLLAFPNRAVVASAGNGFEADCHVKRTVAAGARTPLDWILNPDDATVNDVELWYPGNRTLEVSLLSPDGMTTYGPFAVGADQPLPSAATGKEIGRVVHKIEWNLDRRVKVFLNPTAYDAFATPTFDLAPAGAWKLVVENMSLTPCEFHAWVQRDDVAPRGGRRQQSHFDPAASDPRYTIGDFATGGRTISVGAHNAGTQEVGRYSACGPTRAVGGVTATERAKPDVLAPGEELPHGRGVMASSSARAHPTRLGGTSTAAPHVAGLVALMQEYAVRYGGGTLTADQILAALTSTGSKGPLVPNELQAASRYPLVKQTNTWIDIIGDGKVDFLAAMHQLFP